MTKREIIERDIAHNNDGSVVSAKKLAVFLEKHLSITAHDLIEPESKKEV